MGSDRTNIEACLVHLEKRGLTVSSGDRCLARRPAVLPQFKERELVLPRLLALLSAKLQDVAPGVAPAVDLNELVHGSILRRQHDRHDTPRYRRVTWIVGQVPNVGVVVVDLEKVICAIDLDAGEVMLAVRIVSLVEICEGANCFEQLCLAPTTIPSLLHR